MQFNNKQILITDNIHNLLIDKLKEYGFIIIQKLNITRTELKQILPDFEGIIIRSKIIFDKELLEVACNLRFIARAGSGMENIDVDLARNKGIECINSPEGNRDSVGEHTIGLILSLLHNINIADKEIKQQKWDRYKNRVNEIQGKIIGIIGYGNTGSAFAKKVKSLGAEIIAYDKYKSNFSDEFVKEVTMNDIFKYSDIVSLHIPLTSETKYLVDNVFFNSFTNNIIFVNTSRGPIVDTHALVMAIKSGKVVAAGLDVLEYEGIAFESLNISDNEDYNFLCQTEKIIMTPHIAGLSYQSEKRHAEILAEKIIKLLNR
ncbi:MAG TPA: NAD(P)-dependent oxidoreductase [Bacteroidales bacterium]|nr:NAD(P)-dependent oxidoreductase [Bacteroidales bacterium]